MRIEGEVESNFEADDESRANAGLMADWVGNTRQRISLPWETLFVSRR